MICCPLCKRTPRPSYGHVTCSTCLWEVILPSPSDIRLGHTACIFMIHPSRTFKSYHLAVWLFFFFFHKTEIQASPSYQVPEWEYVWNRATTRLWQEQGTTFVTVQQKRLLINPSISLLLSSPSRSSFSLSFPEDGSTRFLCLQLEEFWLIIIWLIHILYSMTNAYSLATFTKQIAIVNMCEQVHIELI